MKCEDGKKTSRSSLFESIRWLREPASEERLFGLRVCKPWISSVHWDFSHIVTPTQPSWMIRLKGEGAKNCQQGRGRGRYEMGEHKVLWPQSHQTQMSTKVFFLQFFFSFQSGPIFKRCFQYYFVLLSCESMPQKDPFVNFRSFLTRWTLLLEYKS